jgi:mono/diheme cytochrome c family protein
MARFVFKLMTLCLVAVLVSGCLRGRPKQKPPIHPNRNMDNQEKYVAQQEGAFFANNSAMRVPPAGTVARGWLGADSESARLPNGGLLAGDAVGIYYTGKDKDGKFAASPLPISAELLERGQQRFNIYCLPCHGTVGDGKGIVAHRGKLAVPTYHTSALREQADGYIFDIITNGSQSKNMGSYKHQVNVHDRWAIVAYVRALQLSQNATAEDVEQVK